MQLFRYRDGLLPNICALSYVITGYPLAIAGLAAPSVLLFLPSMLLLAHTLVVAAYLLHECVHGTIFRTASMNRVLGECLAWLCGTAYVPYRLVQHKHLRHHADRVDVVQVDYRHYLQRHAWCRRGLEFLQWCHLPAVEILTHILSMSAPFFMPSRRHQRGRFFLVLLSRVVFFTGLALVDWKILPAYLAAYLVFLWVLGFMDMFQHSYEVRYALDGEPGPAEFDRHYEEVHTFSNLLSRRVPWLNLLVLNFCYHNIHHQRSGEPWYRLPALHESRYGSDCSREVPLQEQVGLYQRYRVGRVMQQPELDHGPGIGAAGVSFLVGV